MIFTLQTAESASREWRLVDVPETWVLVLVVLMLGLSVLATVMITRGWSNETVQEQVEQQESERRQAMPRLNPDAEADAE